MKTQRLTIGQVVIEFPENQSSATVHRISPKPVVKATHPEIEHSKRRMNPMKQMTVFTKHFRPRLHTVEFTRRCQSPSR